ncbi:MAG: response regulator [Arcobacteraceae bacterium]|jgi:DNA-binding NtrC family response regulator|nr:response regulator [Arcobacteraceae bacterium]
MDKKFKIAIVDDESEILNMLSRFLQRSGQYEIVTFLNPVNAVATIDDSYDAVMLDIMMPQMGGLEALEKIMDKNPNQKVIMMTAYSTLDKVLKSHKEGATHYLMKPFNSLDSVEKKLQEVLRG